MSSPVQPLADIVYGAAMIAEHCELLSQRRLSLRPQLLHSQRDHRPQFFERVFRADKDRRADGPRAGVIRRQPVIHSLEERLAARPPRDCPRRVDSPIEQERQSPLVAERLEQRPELHLIEPGGQRLVECPIERRFRQETPGNVCRVHDCRV